ncbi:hypothetical protein [Siccirubricoccus sp. G192]|uniref:hypothetical protein n=1 Tax=Siccirubricoccus sp. G192 TaxID=2849651 RepID=UPI001C2C036E|nr:hypothetical protein [Siccirubricoccus sp. G192]MBV1800423.1 hypothetical protein [Siccirubricoccus sp. G192]
MPGEPSEQDARAKRIMACVGVAGFATLLIVILVRAAQDGIGALTFNDCATIVASLVGGIALARTARLL